MTKSNLVINCLKGNYGPNEYLFGAFNTNTDENYLMYCGSKYTNGVKHIQVAHNIPYNLSGEFVDCVINWAEHGTVEEFQTGPNGDRYLLKWANPNGRDVEGWTETGTSDNRIVTVYTKGTVSNDWASCA